MRHRLEGPNNRSLPPVRHFVEDFVATTMMDEVNGNTTSEHICEVGIEVVADATVGHALSTLKMDDGKALSLTMYSSINR